MADLPNLLLASLEPSTRKQAEQSLLSISVQKGFLTHLLALVLEGTQPLPVRLAGSIYLKNIAKLRWDEEVQPLPEDDKAALRSQLVPAMIALSNPVDKTIRNQIAESVALIAQLDFPDKWNDLIDQLVGPLSLHEYNVNVGVLETAHSIFKVWRAQVRSDELFGEINFVLGKFVTPFLQLFKRTAELLFNPSTASHITSPASNYALVTQGMVLLTDIFYDLTCHDLPPAFEDSYDEFFGAEGWFHRFMSWDPPELRGDPDDTEPSLPSKLKTGILEISELWMKLYPEQLQRSNAVATIVQNVWVLIGSNKLPGIADDALVSQALRFISTAIRTGYYKDLFSDKNTISTLVEGVVIPNVSLREHDVEQFEDDPLEFIRLDLSLSATGTDLATRRHAAADVLQALVSSGYENETTEIVGAWINKGLESYSQNKEGNWKAKDSAIFLLTAIATRGSTSQHGVTSTNALVNVVKFFSEHVYQDLQASSGSVHPILQVDAIRFLYAFRNQLNKEQLLSVLPLLAQHLRSENYVTYTYAAITIERVLFIKQNGKLLFSQTDIHESAAQLLGALLSKIESGGTPEKVAENDHLMKCSMRVIITARQTLIPIYQGVLSRLVAILGVISKNPSNPNFDQYIFESISALMRFVVEGNASTLPTFEQALFGPFTIIIQQDIDQYVPYVFQVLAQMLELHTSDIPAEYRSLLPFLLTPAVWQQKGSIPGLVKLLKAFIARDAAQMVSGGQMASVLAVVQQRLVPSKVNDVWGFELLQSVVSYVKPTDLQQYLRPIMMTLLIRMNANKTDIYEHLFAKFILYFMAVNVDGLNPDQLITTVEGIQPQLWSQVLTNFLVPQAPKVPHRDRKLAVIGATRLLTQSKLMLTEPSVRAWSALYTALRQLFSEPQYFTKSSTDDESTGFTEIDLEEQTAGYQAAYSRLAASESKEVDVVAWVGNPVEYAQKELQRLAAEQPAVQGLIQAGGGGL